MNILDQEIILEFFRTHYLFFLGCLFAGSFAVTYYLIPKVLWVSKERKLTAPVVRRSSHAVETPSFGGVAFYITLVLVLTIIESLRLSFAGSHLLAAITILFMVGLKDDLVISTARVKLIGQITATCFIVFSPELQVSNLQGFWGIYEIPAVLGYAFTALLVIGLINAYNLIDGIDGLAAMVGIVISGVFVVIFYQTEHPFYVLVSLSLLAILMAFLRFNFSRGHNKIFMGDSGSLIVGLVLAFLSVKVLVMEPYVPLIREGELPANRLLFLACVLFIPIFDTLRVIIIRKMQGKSAFSPDRNHVHHVLLDLGLSHKKASFCLALLNLLVVFAYHLFSDKLSNLWLSFVVISMYSAIFFTFSRLRAWGASRAKPTHATAMEQQKPKTQYRTISR